MASAETRAPGAASALTGATAPMNATDNPPSVMDYLDYRQFLKDSLAHLQSLDKKFSQRWVAKRAGFNSPQLLTMILKGQRQLTREKALHVAQVLKMQGREIEYLLLIVELADCVSNAEQKAILDRIRVGFRDGLFQAMSDDQIVIYREWYFPAVREIVTLAEAPKTRAAYPAFVAARLGITENEANEALDILIDKGFLQVDAAGAITRAEPSVIHRSGKPIPMYLGAYHMKMLERAFNAVRLPQARRHFQAVSFAMPRNLLPRLRQEVRRFVTEIDTLAESECSREDVFHLQVCLFPLTQDDSE